MCGICGIYNYSDKQAVKKMAKKISHRGPDSNGFYVDEKISLGFRRLSIIDLKSGNQPIFNEDKNACIIFNGEIYNYKELRKFLEKKKHRFYTNSDTETIIHSYEEFGEKCVNYLEGMFAFAIWDMNKKQLFIARDRVGIKPLYYTINQERVIFASEIKAIFQIEDVPRKIDIQSLNEMSIFGHTIGNSTMFKDIKELKPGHLMTINSKGIKIKKYWDIKSNPKIISEKNTLIKVKKLFTQSVKEQMVSDVPLGVFLSGGIDSSILTATTNKMFQGDLKTFSIADSEYNEDLMNARMVAQSLNTNHHEFIVDPEQVIKEIPKYIYHLESPDYKFIFWYLVAKKASKYVKTGFSGEGADEQFCGYPMYKDVLNHKSYLEKRYKITNPQNFRREEYFRNLIYELTKKNGIYSLINYGLKSQLNHLQLTPVDHSTMGASIEVRVPYLNTRFLEFTSTIPINMKIKGIEKYILRKSFRDSGLPTKIIQRKKLFGGRATFQNSFKLLENISRNQKINNSYKNIFKNRKSSMFIYDIFEKTFIENNCKICKNIL
ncbi:MAG: asparagine synthase (glutamine-hydrolyzing) [archaeon]